MTYVPPLPATAYPGGGGQSAVREWAGFMEAFKEAGQQLYFMLGRPDAIFENNELAAAIAGAQDPTAPLQDAAGSVGMTAGGAAAARALTEAWKVFMTTPIPVAEGIELTPLQIISRRS